MPRDDRLSTELRQDVEAIRPDIERHLRAVRERRTPGPGLGGFLAAGAAAIIMVAVLVLGIAPDPSRVSPGATPTATVGPGPIAPDVEGVLIGTSWTVTLLSTDPRVDDLRMAGEWTIRFADDSSLEVEGPFGILLPGAVDPPRAVYAITADGPVTNLFAASFGDACASPGSYRPSVQGSFLMLTGQDICAVRHVLLTTRAWTRDR